MKIHALTTFLDGRDRFEAGDTRTVEDERGAYFVAQGWAADVTGGAEASLEIHDSTIGQEAQHG